jgi:hypothetical protein
MQEQQPFNGISVIHYFNPGHETAVLNGSEFYRPPANVLKMQENLALLPAWYAAPDDYILLPDGNLVMAGKIVHDKVVNNVALEVAFWGISPQSVRFLKKWQERRGLSLTIPEWKDEYRFLGSRFASQQVLSQLIGSIPEIEKNILPQYFSEIEAVENHVINSVDKQLVKSPFSSSGRGLVWLPPGELARSEKQIISGMLKKQSQVSVEKALDKQLDFSMHFEINETAETHFVGYSVFQTNGKGAYEKSLLANQTALEEQITTFIDKRLLLNVQSTIRVVLDDLYAPHYKGTIGIDMLIYRSENQYKLHPCVEINMRKSMGYLAIRLFERHIHPDSTGEFRIEYHPDSSGLYHNHHAWQNQHPLIIENERIKCGYRSLCPVTETTNYHAYMLVF